MPFSYRQIFIALFVVGFILCVRGGIGKIAANNDWVSPFAILGYLFGALAITLFIFILTGHKFPFVSNDKQAVFLLGGIIILKIVIEIVYSILKK
jgi:hypothetical protein